MKSPYRSNIQRDLKAQFDLSKTKVIGEKVAAIAFSKMQDRTAKGQFIGGKLQNKGYSTNPISAWKLGKVTYLGRSAKTGEVKKGKDPIVISIKRPTMSPVQFKKSEMRWGKMGAVILGGYKEFRNKSGRESGFVTLTLSGRMLNSFNYVVKAIRSKVSIVFGFAPSQDEKAYYTNKQRKFVGLTDPEIEHIRVIMEKEIEGLR